MDRAFPSSRKKREIGQETLGKASQVAIHAPGDGELCLDRSTRGDIKYNFENMNPR